MFQIGKPGFTTVLCLVLQDCQPRQPSHEAPYAWFAKSTDTQLEAGNLMAMFFLGEEMLNKLHDYHYWANPEDAWAEDVDYYDETSLEYTEESIDKTVDFSYLKFEPHSQVVPRPTTHPPVPLHTRLPATAKSMKWCKSSRMQCLAVSIRTIGWPPYRILALTTRVGRALCMGLRY